MTRRISNEELERALREAVDENGVDRRLADATAQMSHEYRNRSEENLRRSLAEARASLRSGR
jgi:hypothetical protein